MLPGLLRAHNTREPYSGLEGLLPGPQTWILCQLQCEGRGGMSKTETASGQLHDCPISDLHIQHVHVVTARLCDDLLSASYCKVQRHSTQGKVKRCASTKP